jgi:methionyl-tRNA formyltransferase
LRIAFAGTPAFAVTALQALLAARRHIVGVLTQPDRPRGRGRLITASPVKQTAQAHGLPVSQPLTLATPEARAELEAWRPDVLVVVAYGLILPRAVLELPRHGCLNIHASLLPRGRAAAPIQRAILAGDLETGVTIMRMDAGLDTGSMLLQRRIPIDGSVTSGLLHERLAVLGAAALLDALHAIETGAAREVPQPAEGVTYAAKIEKSEALIEWSSSASAIERKVRAFNPWPMAETRLAGEPLRILAARAEAESPVHAADPGTVLAIGDDAIVVRCGSGRLAITELQRAGRRPLAAGAFANGGSLAPGQRLG